MQELTMNEIEQVSGGVFPLGVAVAMHLAGNAGSIWAWYSYASER